MMPILRDGLRFYPTNRSGNYRLPRKVFDLLEVRLRGFKNREAAHILAAFLGRMNAVPERHGRNGNPFPIDRRALAGIDELGLAEYVIRGALKTLEAVGFIDRQAHVGSAYQRAISGQTIRRKPILFVFGWDFAPVFAWIVRKCLSRPIDRGYINSVLTGLRNPETKGQSGILSMGQQDPAAVVTGPEAFDFDLAAAARAIRAWG